MEELQAIYLGKIREAQERLSACERFLDMNNSDNSIFFLEAAILQLRKAMESIALAAIAPNKQGYASYRAKAEKSPDFTKDFKAGSIFSCLGKVNADFYPVPLSSPISVSLEIGISIAEKTVR